MSGKDGDSYGTHGGPTPQGKKEKDRKKKHAEGSEIKGKKPSTDLYMGVKRSPEGKEFYEHKLGKTRHRRKRSGGTCGV